MSRNVRVDMPAGAAQDLVRQLQKALAAVEDTGQRVKLELTDDGACVQIDTGLTFHGIISHEAWLRVHG